MRLWHKDLIPVLPRQQLLGQHREICALRGRGWGKKHATVNYVFEHPYSKLYNYHVRVIQEMERRGYKAERLWLVPSYRGKAIGHDTSSFTNRIDEKPYREHNREYLQECLENLRGKGINLS